MHQLGMASEECRAVPLWGVPSPEGDNLLADCFIGYDSAKGTSRRPSIDLGVLPGEVLGGDQKDLSKWFFAFNTTQNEERRVSYSSDSGSDSGVNDDIDDDMSWLEECMNVYGITDLAENDAFDMKGVDVAVGTPEPVEKDDSAIASGPADESKKKKTSNEKSIPRPALNVNKVSVPSSDVESEITCVKERSRKRKAGDDVIPCKDKKPWKKVCSNDAETPRGNNVCRRSSIGSHKDRGRKKVAIRTGSGCISERKREQNRYAAIRYRDKRREEAKQKKEELHELELRNVQLKTELSWLEKEVAYLKNLMKLRKST